MKQTEIIEELILALQDIDYGHANSSPELQEEYLLQLEDIANVLTSMGQETREIDLAIRYFMTDQEKSRTYIYGPSDVGNGLGVLENLRSL